MKKYAIFIFGILTLLVGVNQVNADCDYAKQALLNAQVANMDFKYDFDTRSLGMGAIDDEEIEVQQKYIKVYVYNLTEDLKMTVRDVDTKQKTSYSYNDVKDGVITIDVTDVSKVNNYEFSIFPVDTTCGNDEIRIHTMSIPKFNDFTYLEMCEETPEFYLCQEFIDVEKTFDDFVEEREQYLLQLNNEQNVENDDNSFVESITSFLNKYKFVILGVVVIGGVGAYVIVNKKRSRII